MCILHINANYISTKLHQNMTDVLEADGIKNNVFVPAYKGRPLEVEERDYAFISRCFRKSDRFLYFHKQNKIIASAREHYRPFNFDCIHAYTLFSDGNVAMRLAAEHHVPYVVAVRDTDVSVFFRKRVYLRPLGVKILYRAAVVFFLSETYKEEVLGKYVPARLRGVIEKKSRIIPNGIDEFWMNNRFYRDTGKTAARMQGDKIVRCVFAGKIIKRKNIETTLKALTKLNESGYHGTLTVVGDKTDSKIYDRLKTYECFRYVEPKKKEELISYYRDADIFVMPSFTETFGLSYAEAMSQGLPVIYTRGQGFDGQFEEGSVGYSVDARSPEEIASAIVKITDNYEKISSNCTESVTKFDWNALAAQYKSIYEKITSSPAKRRGLIIAFVGVDGAGKSTVTDEIDRWIGKRSKCVRFYMGTGDGRTTLFSDAMKKARKVAGDRGVDAGRDGKTITFASDPVGYIRKLVRLLTIYDVERKNNSRIRLMDRYRNEGIICVMDRFPQLEAEGENDGPKVCVYEKIFGDTWFIRKLKAAEQKQMAIVKKIKPDIVFRLNISAETSMSRKPEQRNIEQFRNKITSLNKITFQNAKIIDINAEQPYEDELNEIKSILREYI